MINGWWIAALLLLALLGLAFYAQRLKGQLRQEANEQARLRYKLTSSRRELAEVNARRKKLLAAATQALIIVESDYSISSANKVAKRLFGKHAKESTLMAWTRQHRLQELVEETFRGTKKLPAVYFFWEDQHFEARARAIKSEKKVVAVALAVHDVTELERLSRARRDFVTNISHELRTPLASLRLLTDTLLNGVIDEDKEMTRALVSKIAGQTDTLSQLAQEILDLSMIESGKLPLRMAPHSLQIITNTEIDHLQPQAERKHITLTSTVDDDITVLVDEKMVGRVVINLLHNAIKFTDQGSVTVSAKRSNGNVDPPNTNESDGTWVTVSVSDTGVGIASDELPRLFERFYKIDRSRHRQDSGTGLGLAIAKHIVEAHGGHIWAESDGNGATFLFTLPAENIAS
jgi:two-component system phosphate regulon sensor histidine kinase PhoR